MAQIKSIGRYFVVYGQDPAKHWLWARGNLSVDVPCWVGLDHVVEDTDWEWDENHRDGRGLLAHLGGWCFGVGAFEKGLSPEMLDWIEEQAVWLDEIEPGDIGRWVGSRHSMATQLGRDYQVRRPTADEAAEATAGDEYPRAEADG